MEIVEVLWVDAGFENSHLSEEQVKAMSPMPRKNVGYLIVNNEEKLILCFGYIEDREHNQGVWDGALVIPKGLVKDVKATRAKKEG